MEVVRCLPGVQVDKLEMPLSRGHVGCFRVWLVEVTRGPICRRAEGREELLVVTTGGCRSWLHPWTAMRSGMVPTVQSLGTGPPEPGLLKPDTTGPESRPGLWDGESDRK